MSEDKSQAAKSKAIKLPGARILLVVGSYHSTVSDQLVKGAEAAIKAAGASSDRVEVPGAFEMPAAIIYASCAHAFDGYVALGAVVKGRPTITIISAPNARTA